MRVTNTRKKTAAPDAQATFVTLLRTVERLRQGVLGLLKPAGLSEPQYNVLRILRGGPPEGLQCSQIGERMITRVPDITRLLDRLEQKGLLRRQRADNDRRVVRSQITAAGQKLLASLDKPVTLLHRKQLTRLNAIERGKLVELLGKL